MPFYSSDERRKCCKLLLKELEEDKEEIQVTVRLANAKEIIMLMLKRLCVESFY